MKRILSGITPSGDGSLHIGNYLGAVRQFAQLSKTHECFLMVADLHALTTVQNKKQLQHNIESLVLNELALLIGDLGPNLPNITFFRQSDVPLHAELQTILNNYTSLGLLKRAHAYKDKLAKEVMEDEVNLGLFNYPVLMAADILIYKPDLVPVGKDQKQHIEITRDIAERFNKNVNGNPSTSLGKERRSVFKLPEPHIPEEVAVVLGTDGKRKMSKSLGNVISIFEDDAVIKKQVMSTYTDPTRTHATDPGHVEGNMVFAYLDHFGEKEKVTELKNQYKEGKVADVKVKEYLFESLMRVFGSARSEYQKLKADPKLVKSILMKGAEKAKSEAVKTMNEVRNAIGLTNQYSFFSYSHPDPSFDGEGSRSMTASKNATLDSSAAPQNDSVITIDEFARLEQRVGKVVKAENKEGSDKLIRLTVNFGTFGQKIIFTGVRPFGYTPEDFADKQFLFVTNLAPRKMMGEESQGMILAVDGEELPFGEHGIKKPIFIPAEGMPPGAKIR